MNQEPAPGGDLELITDGEGIAVFGDPAAVELFVMSAGVPSQELDLRGLTSVIAKGGSALQTASEVSANAGRWMKLTEESARAAQAARLGVGGQSMVSRGTGVIQATTRGANGQLAKNLQFVAKPGAMLANPAILAGVGGLMAQYAMQKQMPGHCPRIRHCRCQSLRLF